jgi:hypothetical protein
MVVKHSVFKLLKSFDVILATQLIALLKEVDTNNLRTFNKLEYEEKIASFEYAIPIGEFIRDPMRKNS